MMMIGIIIVVMVIVMMSIHVLLTFISVITMIVIASPSIHQYHSITMIMMILNVCHLFGHIDVLTLYQYYYGCDFFLTNIHCTSVAVRPKRWKHMEVS